MISIKTADNNIQPQWDNFVLNNTHGLAYHLFAWKKAVENAYRHTCCYLYAEQKGDLVGILPLVNLRFPFVLNELVALPYCDFGNCLSNSEDVQEALLSEAIAIQKKNRCRKLQLRGNLHESRCLRNNFRHEDTGKVRMLLRLPVSSEELWSGFKSKLRSQVRKAEKNGLIFQWGGLKNLDDIYRVFAVNMHQLGSPVHSKKWLQEIILQYGDRVRVGMVLLENQVVGMGIILLGSQTVSIPWASTLRDFNRLSPNMLLYWNFLKFSADNNFQYFDFGRSTKGEGTYRFKKQWGAEPRPLFWYTDCDHSQENSRNGKMRERAENIWMRLPMGLANFMGPMIRKYISL